MKKKSTEHKKYYFSYHPKYFQVLSERKEIQRRRDEVSNLGEEGDSWTGHQWNVVRKCHGGGEKPIIISKTVNDQGNGSIFHKQVTQNKASEIGDHIVLNYERITVLDIGDVVKVVLDKLQIDRNSDYFVGSIYIACDNSKQIKSLLNVLENQINVLGVFGKTLQKMEIHTPVFSKTIEYLYQRRRPVYDKLIDNKIVFPQEHSQGWFTQNGKPLSGEQYEVEKAKSAEKTHEVVLDVLQRWTDKNKKNIQKLEKTERWKNWSNQSYMEKVNAVAKNEKWPPTIRKLAGLTSIIRGASNVPKFTVKREGGHEFDVQFHRLYQSANVNSTQIIPQSNVALASLSWTFGDWNQEDGVVSFNLTTTGNSFGNMQFSFHIDDTSNDFKFDVTFSEVPASFWKANSGAIVLSYKIQQKGSDATLTKRSGSTTTVDIGDDGYMDTKDSGRSREETKEVVVIVESPIIYNTYERFEEELIHDPRLGFLMSSPSTASTASLSVLLIASMFLLMI